MPPRIGIFFISVLLPYNIDHDDPSANGIDGARSFSLHYQSKVDNCSVKIGIWHILPKSTYERLKGDFEDNIDKEELSRKLDEELANSQTPIMMYCHGNSNSRAAGHRKMLYKALQKMDFHTIAFDYRGFGDSTNLQPTEDGVVEDSLIVYEWIHNTVEKSSKKPPIFVWGHSLGTGISSHLFGSLEELCATVLERESPLPQPNGLILESPFTNLADEVAAHPLAKLVTWLPYHDAAFLSPFRDRNEPQTFRSDCYLARVTTLPVLILHARGDLVVPYVLGKRLYNSIMESRKYGGATVKLHVYEKKEKLGHMWICKARDLHEVVGEFVQKHR
ncbi:hypothetical protein evm_005386 [Chilo suppressalis]|nr:hypothetical protein evm_005386 [Chilo suppressalis]